LEPTPLPITGTPQNANIASRYAQYDHWTEENHDHSNATTWVADAPTGFTHEPTPLPIENTPPTANIASGFGQRK